MVAGAVATTLVAGVAGAFAVTGHFPVDLGAADDPNFDVAVGAEADHAAAGSPAGKVKIGPGPRSVTSPWTGTRPSTPATPTPRRPPPPPSASASVSGPANVTTNGQGAISLPGLKVPLLSGLLSSLTAGPDDGRDRDC